MANTSVKECLDGIKECLDRGDLNGCADECCECVRAICTTPPPSATQTAAGPSQTPGGSSQTPGGPGPNAPRKTTTAALAAPDVAECDRVVAEIVARCANPNALPRGAGITPGQVGLIIAALQFVADLWSRWKTA